MKYQCWIKVVQYNSMHDPTHDITCNHVSVSYISHENSLQ